MHKVPPLPGKAAQSRHLRRAVEGKRYGLNNPGIRQTESQPYSEQSKNVFTCFGQHQLQADSHFHSFSLNIKK